jgi:DNA-binding response OmpR family regulator
MEHERTTISVLLVDDDVSIRESLGGLLSDHGYIVTTAKSGVDGFAILKEHEYDIHITDINMPDVDGIEFMKMSRAYKPEAQFIMITGFGDEEKAADSLNNGAFAYLKKPVRGEVLCATIERCLDYRAYIRNKHMLQGMLLTIANLEHNINNTLVSIMGNADILKIELAGQPKVLESLEEIIRGAEIIAEHIKTLKKLEEITIFHGSGGDMLNVNRPGM